MAAQGDTGGRAWGNRRGDPAPDSGAVRRGAELREDLADDAPQP